MSRLRVHFFFQYSSKNMYDSSIIMSLIGLKEKKPQNVHFDTLSAIEENPMI